MSIIFDALKRAEAQSQKGQAPKLASARTTSHTRSKVRIWALASVFVVLALSTWWFSGSPIKPSDTIAATDAAKPSATPREVGATAGESPLGRNVPGDRVPLADLSLKEASAVVQNPVVATDLRVAELNASGVRRLSVPSLDTPLTGAVQFDRTPEPVLAAAPPVSTLATVKPIEPPLAKPAPMVDLSQPKPAEATVTLAPIAEVAPPVIVPPIVEPEPALPTVFELDYKVRFELPKMAVSMYVYNAQQQFRFVIIGGKRYAEGEQIDSKVSITKIRADGLECEFQGTRFFYPRQSL